MFWATVAVIGGIALAVLSADKFVEGAASLASRLGMSQFADWSYNYFDWHVCTRTISLSSRSV